MSMKNVFGNIIKQASDYLENTNIKDKLIEMKDKTVDKVKGIDNPEHYSAPSGFTLFQDPVSTENLTAEQLKTLKSFSLKGEKNILDAYTRLLSLLLPDEEIATMISASMKKTYLIVWTTKDRIIIVHKEHYKILNREEMKYLKIENTTAFGISFLLNEYQFLGSEKPKVYTFIRKYCYEMTPEYTFQSYLPITKNLNYYERFKYGRLAKENQAINENKKISVLLAPDEFPLVSVFGICDNVSYVLVLSTNEKFYLINGHEYAIISRNEIFKIGMMNKGVFSSEFFLDNYYFTGSGPEESLLKLISFVQDHDCYQKAKDDFFKEHQVLMTFPFEGATSYQTPSGEGMVISKDEKSFLICLGMNRMELYAKEQFGHYELIKEDRATKEDMWTSGVGKTAPEHVVSKEEAILEFERSTIKIYLKNQEKAILEIPFVLMKTVCYKEVEEKYAIHEEIVKYFLEQLDRLQTR